jgi:hypothetical protein
MHPEGLARLVVDDLQVFGGGDLLQRQSRERRLRGFHLGKRVHLGSLFGERSPFGEKSPFRE